MAIIDVEDLIGKHFNLPNNDGEPRDAETVEAALDHADGVDNDSTLPSSVAASTTMMPIKK